MEEHLNLQQKFAPLYTEYAYNAFNVLITIVCILESNLLICSYY